MTQSAPPSSASVARLLTLTRHLSSEKLKIVVARRLQEEQIRLLTERSEFEVSLGLRAGLGC